MVRTVFSISNGCGGFDRDGEIAAIFKFDSRHGAGLNLLVESVRKRERRRACIQQAFLRDL